MALIWDGLVRAAGLIWRGDPEVLGITWLSLRLSGAATVFSLVVGIPLGTLLALVRFPGRQLVVALVNTGMGLPPVVVGLFLSILLWRSGPLGSLELLYTPTAIVLAQFLLALPLIDRVDAGGHPADPGSVSLADAGARRLARPAPVGPRPAGAPAAPGRR